MLRMYKPGRRTTTQEQVLQGRRERGRRAYLPQKQKTRVKDTHTYRDKRGSDLGLHRDESQRGCPFSLLRGAKAVGKPSLTGSNFQIIKAGARGRPVLEQLTPSQRLPRPLYTTNRMDEPASLGFRHPLSRRRVSRRKAPSPPSRRNKDRPAALFVHLHKGA